MIRFSNISLRATIVWTSLIFANLTLAQQEHSDNHNDHQSIDEIIVSGSINKTRTETALPLHILTGEELRNNAASTIGETIEKQLGVQSSSFGTGVGQPIIRGLTGNRVTVLQNNLRTQDASNLSADHADSVEALLSERIEIIRGPATLLYGNGAIGGVVNIIDNRIPETLPDSLTGAFEARHNTGNDNKAGIIKLDGLLGTNENTQKDLKKSGLAWHFDAVVRENNNTEIPGYALDVHAIEAAEHQNESDDSVAHDEEHDMNNTKGYLDNSSAKADQFSLGGSWITSNGFIGVSFSQLNNNYGIPPGAHEHEESLTPTPTEADQYIRIDLNKNRTEIKTAWDLNSFFDRISAQLSLTDYKHVELEGEDIGTTFINNGYESRISANHSGIFSGVFGVQMGDRDFSAVGDEAFIPKSRISTLGFFTIESIDIDSIILEMGVRIDQQKINAKSICDQQKNSWSANIAAIAPINSDSHVSAALSRGERAPTVEELFSNMAINTCTEQSELIEHAATQRFEIGNSQLKNEISENIEFGYYHDNGTLHTEFNIFYNQFNDFIYLIDNSIINDEIISRYVQDDAIFYGLEGQVAFPVTLPNGNHIDITFSGDSIRAKLNNGESLPRIAPNRFGIEMYYSSGVFSSAIQVRKVFSQNDVSKDEASTNGYTRLDLTLDYHIDTASGELQFFLKGKNLTDQEIRDHTSFLKNVAPVAGRSFELGMRWMF